MSSSLPQGWEEKELSKVADYITEKVEVNNITLDNYISTENMNPNIGGVEKASSLPNVNKVNEFKKEDILFSNIRTYFKKIWFATFDGGSSTDVLTIRKKEKDFCSKYLYYSLTTENYFDYTVKTSKGTKMPRGDKNAIMQYKIKYPTDTNEQKRITDILSAFDYKIELNNQMNQTLEDMATALFKEWFENFNFPNDEGKAYKENGGEFKSSELGEIPIDWEVGELGNIAIFKNGKTSPDRNEVFEIPVFGSNGNIGKTQSYNFENVIVIGRVGSYCGSLYYLLGKCWVTDNAMIGKSKFEFGQLHLLYLLRRLHLNNRSTGSGQPLLNQSILKSIKIVLPSEDYIEKFNNIVEPFIYQIQQNQQQNQTLKKQRDTLLPKLMSGEIRV